MVTPEAQQQERTTTVLSLLPPPESNKRRPSAYDEVHERVNGHFGIEGVAVYGLGVHTLGPSISHGPPPAASTTARL